MASDEWDLLDANPGPVHPLARQTWANARERAWADPMARHAPGRHARRLLDQAREVLAQHLDVRPEEVSFHASGDSAARSALAGLARARRRHQGAAVASAVEHSLILRWLAAAEESEPDLLVGVDHHGRVDLTAWAAAVGPHTPFAALQAANGELGTLQPLPQAHAHARGIGVPLLVDARAVLGRGRTPRDYDVLIGDARSFGGPPLGLLVVRTGVRCDRLRPHSPHERGRATDPPDVPAALAAAEAWRQVAADEHEEASARRLVDQIRRTARAIPGVEVPGPPDEGRLAHITTISVPDLDGDHLADELGRRGFAVGSGSACTADTLTPSHVLAASGAATRGNIRITLPHRGVVTDRGRVVEGFCGALPEVIVSARSRSGRSRHQGQ